MKGIKWLFGVCLGALAFYGATALELNDVVRAASRASAQKTATGVQSRGVPNNATKQSVTTRNNASTRDRTNTGGGDVRSTKNVASRATVTTQRANTVVPRKNVLSRSTTNTGTTRRTATIAPTKSRTATNTTRTNRPARAATRGARMISRAATDESGALITNYTNCRKVFYECMDEFCATKDTNLRRCACSSRVNEFNSIKKQMDRVEDQMLEFNQKLLLVNMDAEDTVAINTATEGEEAFYATKDKTKSKKALDDIAKKLNDTFDSSDTSISLAPISMSLNTDSAFDTVDSLMGSDTTTKTGPALYNAATPICREVATEVCNDDELSLAVSGYQMLMEQDCNTVFKSYQAQADAARTKVFESSALLDMSRLDAYQTRNADDLLTCKRKMLDMLSDPTVCGTDMQNCLDMTGKYIDPTTGNAFLTPYLPELGNLITRPATDQTWTSANSQSPFLTYLKNKKNYLSAAMENCQAIADSVWDAFIEDALAQIKLAQTAKLEEIRQACTTLTATCLTSTTESITNFDARALSIFGVAADRTANSICSDVQTACAKIVDGTNTGATNSWQSSMTNIATDKTYETIVSSCTQVGRNCIVQACKSISGNFDLCDDITFSANRHAILERTSCWPDVVECVAAAGDDALLRIIQSTGASSNTDYKYALYDATYSPVPGVIQDICQIECGANGTDAACAKCRIAESIWGNCERLPSDDEGGNRILIPKSAQSTLLAWFAINTGTATVNGTSVIADARSCVNTRCATGTWLSTSSGHANMCMASDATVGTPPITSDQFYCPNDTGAWMDINLGNGNHISNCCYTTSSNYWNHSIPQSSVTNQVATGPCCEGQFTNVENTQICLPANIESNYRVVLEYSTPDTTPARHFYLVCVGDDDITAGGSTSGGYPQGDTLRCNGRFVLLDARTGQQRSPTNYEDNGQLKESPVIDSNTARSVYYPTEDASHSNPQLMQDFVTNPAFFIHYGD